MIKEGAVAAALPSRKSEKLQLVIAPVVRSPSKTSTCDMKHGCVFYDKVFWLYDYDRVVPDGLADHGLVLPLLRSHVQNVRFELRVEHASV